MLHKSKGWYSHRWSCEWSPLEVCDGALSLKLISLSWKEIPVHLKTSEVTRSVCFTTPMVMKTIRWTYSEIKNRKNWFGIKMYPRHSIIWNIDHWEEYHLWPTIYTGKKIKSDPPNHPSWWSVCVCPHGQPRARCLRRAVILTLEVYNLARGIRLTPIKRAEGEQQRPRDFYVKKRVSAHMSPRGFGPWPLELEPALKSCITVPSRPNTASLQKVGDASPKCYRFQCCGPGETKATEGKCF